MSIKRVIKRKAFTLVEMVMVIVILGIVGMIGSDIIAKMYQGYIKSKITNDLQQKTELVIEQIVRRFGQRIKDTTIGRHVDVSAMIDSNLTADGNDTRYMKLNDDNISNIDPNVVEWIGYDNESYMGESNGTYSRPGWSGFIDIGDATTGGVLGSIATPGSDLNIADSVINTLSGGTVDLTGAAKHPVLISKCIDDSDMSKYGWDMGASGGDKNETIIVNMIAGNNTHFQMANIGQRNFCEQYYLAWSAYALIPVANPKKADDFNLTLRYNYQPWYNENYTDGTSQVLAEHISTFRVMQVGDSVRVKVCIHDGNITGTQYTFCKEKAIF
jgi:prepilin-type N-terminal cleavage/methylation domain-containing protein